MNLTNNQYLDNDIWYIVHQLRMRDVCNEIKSIHGKLVNMSSSDVCDTIPYLKYVVSHLDGRGHFNYRYYYFSAWIEHCNVLVDKSKYFFKDRVRKYARKRSMERAYGEISVI